VSTEETCRRIGVKPCTKNRDVISAQQAGPKKSSGKPPHSKTSQLSGEVVALTGKGAEWLAPLIEAWVGTQKSGTCLKRRTRRDYVYPDFGSRQELLRAVQTVDEAAFLDSESVVQWQERSAAALKKMENDPEMLEEHDFSEGVRGKYAGRYAEGTNVVVVDPDVAQFFSDHDSANDALRHLVAVIAGQRKGNG
jgi:hypothetical protein